MKCCHLHLTPSLQPHTQRLRMPASKAVPFLVIMDGGPIPFQRAEGKTVIFSSGEANRGTGRRGSQAKGGGEKQVVV